jgi:hypothetical protein
MLWGIVIHYLLAVVWRAAEVGRFWAAAYAAAALVRQGSWWPIPDAFWALVGLEVIYLLADQCLLRWEAYFYPRAEARLATEAATEDVRRGDLSKALSRAAQARELGELANRYGCRFASSAAALATNAAAAALTTGLPGLVGVIIVFAVTWRASRRTSAIAVSARAAMEEHRQAAAGALTGTADLGRYTQEINGVAAQRRRIELAEAASDLRVASASSLVTVVLFAVAASGGASAEALVGLYRGLASIGAEAAWIAAATARMAEARTLWRELRAK